jgi:aminoglycoside phosphotransferase (APT) family kinase protein
VTRDDGLRATAETEGFQTATRDLAKTRDQLEEWLKRLLPAEASLTISDLEAPSANGMSSETLLFEVTWSHWRGQQQNRFAARIAPDPANLPVFPVYDLSAQFRLLQLLALDGTVPVPRVWWFEPDAATLGAPFFLMDRIDGRVPPDVLPYNFGSWLSEASEADQRLLQESSIGVLAAIHALPDPRSRFDFLLSPGEDGSLRAHMAGQRRYYEWVADGVPSPLLERCFDWLEDHWPQREGPAVLSWGDARIGNIIYRDFTPVAVLDWEMASLGPREIDVAWFIFLHRFFEEFATGAGLPGMPHFLRREDVVATYQDASGTQLEDLDFYLVYAALRNGIVMRATQRRAIHFGQASMPADVDDLIFHRSSIERMLEGTYWDAVA